MKKRVLVLTGSPRKNGNSDLLADALIKGAQERGHSVTKLTTADKRIGGCTACNACFSKGRACVFDDDFNQLAPHLENADVLVFAAPLYWFTFPAQIKAAIDKFYAFGVGERPLPVKETLLLTCGETDDVRDFDGLVLTYERMTGYMKWEDKGRIIVTGVNDKGDILKTNALAEAETLGKSI